MENEKRTKTGFKDCNGTDIWVGDLIQGIYTGTVWRIARDVRCEITLNYVRETNGEIRKPLVGYSKPLSMLTTLKGYQIINP